MNFNVFTGNCIVGLLPRDLSLIIECRQERVT